MPQYVYSCPNCLHEQTRLVPWAMADAQRECPCGYQGYLNRLPVAPSFVIHGFAAKNGYSK